MSTIKVNTLTTLDGTGNITVSRPLSGSGASLTALNATELGSGTVPDARFPATLPAASGVNLTALNATQATSGTLPMARLSGTLPALNGSALTDLPGNLKVSSTDGAYSSNTTGTFTVSSLGFTPKFVTCLYHDHTSNNKWSVGFATYRSGTITASQYCIYDDSQCSSTADYRTQQGYIGWMSMSGCVFARLAITTWGSDSIVFTRTVSTSATSALNYKINILG